MTELFFDDFTDPSATNGWVETFDVGNNFAINTVQPEVMFVNQLTGGGGVTEKWVYKDTGIINVGDVKLEMKLDFQNQQQSFSSIMFIRFAEQQVHPANMTGSFIGFTIDRTTDGFHQLRGEVSDGIQSVTTNLGGTQQQHTVWIYANTGFQDSSQVPPAPELLGPYFCTIELKDGELRISVYNDSAKTIHIRGSPIQVSAGGISKGGGPLRRFTGEFDDFRISINEPLETIPIVNPPQINVENWESYQVGETSPDGWTFGSSITPVNGGTFSLDETEFGVSDAMPDPLQIVAVPDYIDRMKANPDLPFDTLLNPNAFIKKLWFANGPPLTSATCATSPLGVGVDPRNPDKDEVQLDCANSFLFIDPVSEVLRFVNLRATGNPLDLFPSGEINNIGTPIGRILDPFFPFKFPNAQYDNFDPLKKNFTIRFQMNFEQVVSSFENSTRFFVGVMAKSPNIQLDQQGSPTGAQDSYGIRFDIFQDSSQTEITSISMVNGDSSPPLQTATDFTFATTYTTGSNFFFQIRRFNDGTEYALDIFQDGNYEILIETHTALSKFTQGDLQWFTLGGSVRQGGTTGGSITGFIDKLEVYNGVAPQLGVSTLSYRIRQKFIKDNQTGTVEGNASIAGGINAPPLVPTFTVPTGGGLDIPVQMEARLKGNIVSPGTGGSSLGTTYAGIAVVYHFIDGAPSTDSINSVKIPQQGVAHVGWKGVNTDSILPPFTIPVFIGFGLNPSTIQMEVISEESKFVGNYGRIASNIRRDLNERSASFDSQGLDYNAHVTGITLVPFVITNSGVLLGNVETEIFADNLILRPPSEILFSVSAVLQAFGSSGNIGLRDITSLVAYWDFDEITGDLINRATDIGSPESFGSIADGELQENPSTSVTDIGRGVTSAKPNIGTSYRFFGDGTDNPGSSQDGNEIKIGDDSTAQKALWKFLTDARFTYNAWVQPNSGATSGGYLLITSNNTSFNPGIQIFITPVLSPPDPPVWNLSCTLRKFLTTLANGVMVGKIKSDEKQMVTITYDRNAPAPQMRFYINGVERADGSNTGATLGSENPNFTPRLGTNVNPQAGTTYNGLMDEVSVWARVLQPNEIKQLYCIGQAEQPLAQGSQTGCLSIDGFIGDQPIKEKTFGIKAKLQKDGVFDIPYSMGATLVQLTFKKEFKVSPLFKQLGVEKDFTINAQIVTGNQEIFEVNALVIIPPAGLFCLNSFLQATQINDFTINAIIGNLINFEVGGSIKGDKTEDFTVNAELIIGSRVNLEYTINAILIPTQVIQLVPTINAILVNRRLATFLINGDPEIVEPRSILQAESVIGFRTGLLS